MWAATTGVTNTLLMAAETSPGFDPVQLILNMGPAGVVIVLMLTGKLRIEAEVKRLELEMAAKDKTIELLQSTVAAQNQATVDRVIPALTLATHALGSRATSSDRE